MKKSKNDARGLTLIELLVVIAIVAFFAAMIPVATPKDKAKARRIGCTSNLKQVGLAFRIWTVDSYAGKFPMELSITNGGAMEALAAGDLVAVFEVMSNELNAPKILYCPADNSDRGRATHFGRNPLTNNNYASIPFTSNSNITYFVGMDASKNSSQLFLTGDDNLLIGSAPVKSGVLSLAANSDVSWSKTRHDKIGNVGLADGSVQGFSSTALKAALKDTGLAINRLAMP